MLILDERRPYSSSNPPPEKYDLVKPTGIMKAAAMAALKLPVDVAGAGLLIAGGLDEILFDRDNFFKLYDDEIKPIQDKLTPEPGSVSAAGRFISGIAGFAPALLTGPAAIPILAGQSAINTGAGLVEQSVGPGAATAAGILSGATTAAMAGIPQAAKTWTGTLALASLNPVIGAASTEAEKILLEKTGNEKVAAGYDPLDPVARGIDSVLGLAFGAMGKYSKARQEMKTQTKDSIDTVANWQRTLKDTPFDTTDPKAVDLSSKAMTKALTDISQGKPVDLSDVLPDQVPVRTEAMPLREEAVQAKAALAEGLAMGDAERQALEPLTPSKKALELSRAIPGKDAELLTAGELRPGDSFERNGEKFTVEDVTPLGKVKLADGIKIDVPEGQTILADQGSVKLKGAKTEQVAKPNESGIMEPMTPKKGAGEILTEKTPSKPEGGEVVTLYHGTSSEGASKIAKEGFNTNFVYLTSDKKAAERYAYDGGSVISIKVPKDKILMDFDLGTDDQLLTLQGANQYDGKDWSIDEWLDAGKSFAVKKDVANAGLKPASDSPRSPQQGDQAAPSRPETIPPKPQKVIIDAPVAQRMEARFAQEGDFPIHTGTDALGAPTSISAREYINQAKEEYQKVAAREDIYKRIGGCL
jgi:hypothetical protein